MPRRRRLLARAAYAALAAAATACTAPAAGGEPPALERPLLAPVLVPAALSSPHPRPPAPPVQLPRGGRSIFPQHVVVMAYGTAGTGVLGVLGERPPAEAARRLEVVGAQWAKASGRPVLPAFELITTVAQRSPGPDGLYSTGLAPEQVQRYLQAARAARMLLVLDFQPGRANVLEQVKRYERFLLEPEVGIAIDPEWVLKPGQLPGRQVGTLDAASINAVSSYLADLTVKNRLPEKVFLVHQFKTWMLPDREQIVDRPGLALVFHVDGFGARHSKRETYRLLSTKDGLAPGGRAHNGFKLFYDEDVNLMGPRDVMAIAPRPELVSYQ